MMEGAHDPGTTLRVMLDAVRLPVWAVDPVGFALLEWNAAAATELQRTRGVEPRVGQPLAELLSPELASPWRAGLEQALALGRHSFEVASQPLEPSRVEITRVVRDGEPTALVCTWQPIGSPRQEAFYRKVLADSADITSVLARDGHRIYISPGVTKVLGLTVEEGLATAVAQSTHPDDQERVRSTFRKLVAEPGGTARIRFRQRHKNGSFVLVDALTRNALDDPDVGGIVVTTRDVTEQVALEAQLLQAQKLESVGRLAGGVAHDFNNLLTVILSSAECLKLEAQDRAVPRREYVEDIRVAAERACDLTRQLLAFARKQRVAVVLVDLNGLVRATAKILGRMLGEDIELVTHLAPDLWSLRCDPGQVDQILFNLAVNARDAMPSGGRFELLTRNAPGDPASGTPESVVLEISDTGTGMDAEVLAHAFEPFFTTKEVGKGTGLGLATVHGIVEQHGGTIEIESAPGHGTRFVIRFPRASSEAAQTQAPSVARAQRGSETILVVEDDPLVRELEARVLTGAGYRVILACNGDEALELLRRSDGALHLLLTDVVMPRVDGVALHAAVQVERPRLPVLFTSGYADDRIPQEKLVGPRMSFLPKPFTPATLLARVRAMIDGVPPRDGRSGHAD